MKTDIPHYVSTRETLRIPFDWGRLANACLAFEGARRSFDGHFCIGSRVPVTPARDITLAGLVNLRDDLYDITERAWTCIHAAQDSMRVQVARVSGEGWIAEYQYQGRWHLCSEGYGDHAVARPRRDADRVAAHYHGARVRPTDDVRKDLAGEVVEKVRVAVATLLAARPLFDVLKGIGIIDRDAKDSSGAGHDGKHLHATGLRWLAGAKEDRRVTVIAAHAFVEGAGLDVFLAA